MHGIHLKTHRNTLEYTETDCNPLQHAATRCNTLHGTQEAQTSRTSLHIIRMSDVSHLHIEPHSHKSLAERLSNSKFCNHNCPGPKNIVRCFFLSFFLCVFLELVCLFGCSDTGLTTLMHNCVVTALAVVPEILGGHLLHVRTHYSEGIHLCVCACVCVCVCVCV